MLAAPLDRFANRGDGLLVKAGFEQGLPERVECGSIPLVLRRETLTSKCLFAPYHADRLVAAAGFAEHHGKGVEPDDDLKNVFRRGGLLCRQSLAGGCD